MVFLSKMVWKPKDVVRDWVVFGIKLKVQSKMLHILSQKVHSIQNGGILKFKAIKLQIAAILFYVNILK